MHGTKSCGCGEHWRTSVNAWDEILCNSRVISSHYGRIFVCLNQINFGQKMNENSNLYLSAE